MGVGIARPRTRTTPETPKVLDKAIRVLELMGGSVHERSERNIARELRLPRTTVNRILRGFELRGFLELLPNGCYRLGPAVIRLGRRAANLDYASLVRPILEDLSMKTRELVILAIPATDQRSARYVAAFDSPQRLRVTVEVGSSIPLTAGATAKAILAFMSDHVVDALLAAPIQRLAAGTLTSVEAVRDDLARTRDRGFAFSWEETFDGAWAIAAPILDADRKPIGAIGVAVPTSRHSAQIEQAIIRLVRAAARRASERPAVGN